MLDNATIIGLFLIPLIAMRLFAEEKRTGTIELLMTSPLHDWEIVLGKWMGAMTMYAFMVLLSAINMGLLFVWGSPDWKPLLTGYLGLFLQAGTIMAIGSFISSTTRNQIIAGSTTFLLCLLLWVIKAVSSFNDAGWAKALAYCSILTHFEPFSKGVIDTKDIVYYVTAIFLGLFLTVRSLESLRWRA